MRIKRLLIILISLILVSCTNNNIAVVDPTTVDVKISENETTESSSASENIVKIENVKIAEIEKHGNIVLAILPDDFFKAGFDYCDIISVSFLDKKIDMPICEDYFNVDNGEYVCRIYIDKDLNINKVILAIMMGDFVTTNGIATKELINGGTDYRWNYLSDEAKTCSFSFELKEAGGYKEEYLLHKLVRGNNRDDYKNLTDEEYANFRMIKTSGIGDNKVYRSSSPVNPELGRNTYAMTAVEDHGIKTIVNLADSEQEVKAWDSYKDSYYSKQNIITAGLSIDFDSDTFKKGLARVIHLMAESEAPYLIHCTEGKDRAGYLSALLECLMGASLDEVLNDYMVTYYNYYNILPGTEQYNTIRDKQIVKQLETAFGATNLENKNLSELCENFFLSIGVIKTDIEILKTKLQ